MLVEHARLLGIVDAVHTEYGRPGTPVVDELACALADVDLPVALVPGSALAREHGGLAAVERATCRFGLAPRFAWIADAGGMAPVAFDASGEVRAVERPGHPWFVGTLYQPQLRSAPGRPHPYWTGFLRAVLDRGGSG